MSGFIICKHHTGCISVESVPNDWVDSAYKVVKCSDGPHFMMKNENYDYGLVLDDADTITDAMALAEKWRTVASVMES